ncbi:uncharacterized protein ACA1_193190 [Acanthamoeba castellanii str. Neff]|uniref:Selenoprotein F n=1 Tax=Acanthamoeba castellanii (strain ATCC 30010 / Neff) TaxID=1257118 RepID=L8GQW0_ACACF|nr:uncharacterized protein ACA1_193190 [Acanthamoeba castellanii str. Neff]ELR14516.1 hypothetical protein ACA1_193190 [Acanthamoeba castellanii str. Neff]
MKMRAAWGLVVVLALALVMAHGDEKAAECDALGFDAATLSCSSCTLLPTFVHDEGLVADCRKCCSEAETTDDNRVFDHARLEMDKSFMMALAYYHPGLYHFLKGSAFQHFLGLQVVDKSNMKPTLVFLDASGEPQLTTQLGGWKEETIVEYLETKLTNKAGKPIKGAHMPKWLRAFIDKKH